MGLRSVAFGGFVVAATLVEMVSACEGECIVDITKAFLGNYSLPIQHVFTQLGNQIVSELLPPNHRPSDPISLLQPILSAFDNVSYNNLETAIFPSYFHGKCQRFSKDGQDPPGCPDPDCPVVCGTPGSLVHFYSTLRYIAYNSTLKTLEMFTSPGSDPFNEVEARIKAEGGHASKRETGSPSSAVSSASAVYPRYAHADSHTKRAHTRHFGSLKLKRDEVEYRSTSLASIMGQLSTLLAKACGGDATDSSAGLPNCSWEAPMKAYILSFP